MGKEVEYTFPEIPECADEKCWLCGADTYGYGTPVRKTIKPTFTDVPFSREPRSRSICRACTWALSYRELRNYSILATTDGLYHPSREELRNIVLDPPKPPFVLCIAASGQKWLHFKAKVNYSRNKFIVQFEDIGVPVSPAVFAETIEPVEILYNNGFIKDEILNWDFPAHKILEFGLERFQEIEARLQRYRKSRVLELAVFVAQKKE
jgi:CRISPR type IV-associated protein Csf1